MMTIAMRAWRWLGAHTDIGPRDVQFFGGLVLVGAAPGRWLIVGWVLVVHAVFGPLLVRRGGAS